MVYTITAQIYQTNQLVYFHVVEKTVWNLGNGGTWSEVDGTHILTMDTSGTCGSLRFLADSGENCVITLGIDAGSPWGDIVTNLATNSTACAITPQYYDSTNKGREDARLAHLPSYTVNDAEGKSYYYKYTVTGGTDLKVNIVIG